MTKRQIQIGKLTVCHWQPDLGRITGIDGRNRLAPAEVLTEVNPFSADQSRIRCSDLGTLEVSLGLFQGEFSVFQCCSSDAVVAQRGLKRGLAGQFLFYQLFHALQLKSGKLFLSSGPAQRSLAAFDRRPVVAVIKAQQNLVLFKVAASDEVG